MLYKDLLNKSVAELRTIVRDLKAELWTLRFQNTTGSLDQTHKINLIKKDIARALTALSEKGAK
ncbi:MULTISPECIES: 50S ribosomal protein L29 [unclassified Mycoplasma]|uniref:50S ribosomal protein L29 n=1 Tax=unclassified Mycoplasma TaxID=2683645 RepID=UPI00211BB047|nr:MULTISPECIES: 50S ribosomal protein L29 [unclassified Mycoplasma]UUM19964.1 50S ribosomal protein L29 [Mycoplasma sp. 1578d]UUM24945.1 50S ribosomal protein L29 [Mycoplasma sp. 3686d]